MPVFGQANAAMSSMYNYVCNTMFYSVHTTYSAIISFRKQYTAFANISDELEKETRELKHGQQQCGALTEQEIQQMSDQHAFVNAQKITSPYTGDVVLTGYNTALLSTEQEVHEYMAATQLLDVTQSRQPLSHMLRKTLHSIAQVSYMSEEQTDALFREDEVTNSVHTVCVLIENVVFNRCHAIAQKTDYTMAQYMRINEMLQLLFRLQAEIHNIPDTRIQAWANLNSNTCHVSTHTKEVSNATAEHNEHASAHIDRSIKVYGNMDSIDTKLVDVTQVVMDYENSMSLLANIDNDISIGAVCRESFLVLVRAEETQVHYDALLTAQAFVAFAARKELHYEMQRHFNPSREACVDSVVQYARERQLAQDNSEHFAKLENTLIQLRITHALRTYYAHGALGLFAEYILSSQSKDTDADKMLKLRKQAQLCVLLLQSLDDITNALATEFYKYTYAAALIHVLNICGDKANEEQMRACCKTISDQQKESIANVVLCHVLYTMAPICATDHVNVPGNDMRDLHELVVMLSPSHDDVCNSPLHTDYYNEQMSQYLAAQISHILVSLPNYTFHKLHEDTMLSMIQECHNILNSNCNITVSVANEHGVQTYKTGITTDDDGGSNFLVRRTIDGFSIPLVHHNVDHTAVMLSQQLPQQFEPTQTMYCYVTNVFDDINTKYDMRILALSMFVRPACSTQTLYLFTNSIMHHIHEHCISQLTRYGKCVLAIGVSIFALYELPSVYSLCSLFDLYN